METIDFVNYVRAPRISAASGVILTIRLLGAAPKHPTPAEKAALQRLRASAKQVQDAVGDRHGTSTSALRPLDRRFDGSWAGLYGRHVAWTRMQHPNAQRAIDLIATLFPRGLEFLASGYEAQWFHSRMLIDRIHREGLYDDVVELAGPPFMTEVEQAHAALGDALGLDEDAEPEAGPGPSVAARITALADAIADYGRILSGSVDLNDEASKARFLSAVGPIDAFRARKRKPGTSAGEDGIDGQGDQAGQVGDAAEADDDGLDIDSPIPAIDDEG